MTATTDLSRSLLLNGLRDVVMDTTAVVDDETRHRLERSLHDATDRGERGAFVTALHDLEAGGPGRVEEQTHSALRETVDSVMANLASSDARFTVRHESGVDLPPRTVALYNFWQTRDPTAFESASYPGTVMDRVRTGASAAAEGAYEDAVASFDRAVDDAPGGDEAVDTRVLAGLAAHWSGADALALDYVEEALHLDSRSWPATLLGSVVRGESSSRFREGSLAVRAYLRVRARVPTGARLRARLGRGPAGEADWGPWSTELDCLPMDRLGTHIRVALELSGPITGLPTLDAYYFAIGTIEPRRVVPCTVDHVLFDGPLTGDVTEELRLERATE